MWALTKIYVFLKKYVPSVINYATPLSNHINSIHKQVSRFVLVPRRQMRKTTGRILVTDSLIFPRCTCRQTICLWDFLRSSISVTIIRKKQWLLRQGCIYVTCKLENQPLRGGFLLKKVFLKLLEIYRKLPITESDLCKVASATLPHLNYSKNL